MGGRRVKTTGSIYRRSRDGRWMGSIDRHSEDGPRRRRTVSSALFCVTLHRLDELNPKRAAEIERAGRAEYMAAARALGTHTEGEWFAYVRSRSSACEYCGVRCRATKDHRTPVSRGGSDALANLAVACWRCNNLKNNATEAEFRAEIEALGGIEPGGNKPVPSIKRWVASR